MRPREKPRFPPTPQLAGTACEAGGAGTEPLGNAPRPLPPAEVRRACENAAPWTEEARRPRLPPQSRVLETRGRAAPTAHALCRPVGGHLAAPRAAFSPASCPVFGRALPASQSGFLHRVCPTLWLSPQLRSPFSLRPSLASSRGSVLSFRALRGASPENALRTKTWGWRDGSAVSNGCFFRTRVQFSVPEWKLRTVYNSTLGI